MRKVTLHVLLGALLITVLSTNSGQSEATDFTNSTLPIDNTTTYIEEEKEEDESNVTTSTPISKSLQTAN